MEKTTTTENPILKVMEAETLMPTEAGRKEETKALVVRHYGLLRVFYVSPYRINGVCQ